MKKFAILILSILIAGLFVACNQDVTVDAQTYANMEVGTFVLNGQNYATLQAAVDAIGSKAAGDNVIRLTKNASGPGAKIASKDVTIDFQGYTYSFTNVNGLQGQDVAGKDFGLSITTGSDVVLKGLQKIDLNDKTTTDLTMVYVEGATTSLTIEDAPKMEVANSQYVFWAANGASLTIGGKDASESATVTGKVAATGTEESKPTITVQGNTELAGVVKAESAKVKVTDTAAVTGSIEATQAEVELTGNSAVNGSISTSASTVTVGDDSKVNASLTATESSTVTITSKDNVITTLDKSENSTVITSEDLVVEEVTSEDNTIQTTDNAQIYKDTEKTSSADVELAPVSLYAKIGNTLYATLDVALEKVEDNTPTEIVLLGNYVATTTPITIGSNKIVAIDLNGWSVGSGSAHATISNSGVLVIEDSWADAEDSSYVYVEESSFASGDFTIIGGTYIFNPSKEVPAWCSVEEVTTGLWTVAPITDGVAAIERDEMVLEFATLKDAIDYAFSGEEIVILKDVKTSDVINSSLSSLTINLNGKTLEYEPITTNSYWGPNKTFITVAVGKTLNIIDDTNVSGTIKVDPKYTCTVYFATNRGTLNLGKINIVLDISTYNQPVDKSIYGDKTCDTNRAKVSGITNYGTLNISNSTIDNASKGGATSVQNYGTLNMQESILNLSGNSSSSYAINTNAYNNVASVNNISNSTINIFEQGQGLTFTKSIATVSSCTINMSGTQLMSASSAYGIYVNKSAIAVGEPEVLINGDTTITANYSSDGATCINVNAGHVVIEEGVVVDAGSNGYALKFGASALSGFENAAQFEVKGGTYSGEVSSSTKNGTMVISGGSFYGDVYCSNGGNETDGNLKITGGSFSGGFGLSFYQEYYGKYMKISGGSFAVDPSAYLADGYGVIYDKENNTFKVVESWTKGLEPYTEATDLEISTAEELAKYALSSKTLDYAGHTVKLTADIDLEGKAWTPIYVKYGATFDGQDHVISNMNVVGKKEVGLFGTTTGLNVSNVVLDNAVVVGINHVGGIVGHGQCARIEDCTVKNSYIKAYVYDNDDGDKVGAITGYLTADVPAETPADLCPSILNCTVENCEIIGYRDVGSFAGMAQLLLVTAEVEMTGSVSNVTLVNDRTVNYKIYETDTQYDVNEVIGENTGTHKYGISSVNTSSVTKEVLQPNT